MKRHWMTMFWICALAAGAILTGCQKKVEAPPVKVGAIFAITGPASNLGAPEAKTAEMLVEQINQSGGVDGRKIQLIVKDSGSKTENKRGEWQQPS